MPSKNDYVEADILNHLDKVRKARLRIKRDDEIIKKHLKRVKELRRKLKGE